MNKKLANKITKYFNEQGYETSQYIRITKGGECVNVTLEEIIQMTKDLINNDSVITETGNCKIFKDECEEDDYKIITICKDYIEVHVKK